MHHTSPPLCGSWKQRRGHLKHQAVGIPREQTEASRGLCGGQQFFSSKKQGNSTCIPIFSTRSAARSNNATLHPTLSSHALLFRRKVHPHTGIGRPQRFPGFVVFVGDSGSFFPQHTHERFKRKLTRTPGPDGTPRHAPHRDASAFTATSR